MIRPSFKTINTPNNILVLTAVFTRNGLTFFMPETIICLLRGYAQHADASFSWFVPNRPHNYTIFPVLMIHLSKLIQRKRHLIKIIPVLYWYMSCMGELKTKNIASDYVPSTENGNCWNDVIKLVFFAWYDQFDWPNTVVIFSIPLYINDIRSLALISSDRTHSAIYQ